MSEKISIALLHKYNVQGPRYTSYPPAPSWKNEINATDYERVIKESNQDKKPAPLSLYFHLPFCEKLCFFCGCTTVITGKNRNFEEPYLKALHNEIEWLGSRVDQKRPVVQFHLGGGTPTYSAPRELKALLAQVRKYFSFDKNAEVGVEVDPRVTSVEHLKALREEGFNRISMGVQDFDEKVQETINRIQPFEDTKNLVEEARQLGFESVNVDLIYGLPHQTTETFEKTIHQILDIDPDRLAVYSYAHVPWLKHHQESFQGNLPSVQDKFSIFLLAMKLLSASGYEYIGMDHFAKPNDELSKARTNRTLWRNFQGYTTKAGTDLFGLGMSAIGNVHGSYFQNQKDFRIYQENLLAGQASTVRGFHLSEDDKIRSRVIQSLLCHSVVLKQEIETEFGVQFDSYFKEALEKLKEPELDGLVVLSKTEIRPTEVGRVFLRNLAMAFDAYLPQEGEKKVFSRTV